MESKISRLRAALVAGDGVRALRIAAKFPRLGTHRERIQKAWAAYTNPHTYAALGFNPAALIADGLAALNERYGVAATVCPQRDVGPRRSN
jgi:hypothetical protein